MMTRRRPAQEPVLVCDPLALDRPHDRVSARWTVLSDDDLWAEREAYERWVAEGGTVHDHDVPADVAVWHGSRRPDTVVAIRNADGALAFVVGGALVWVG